MFRSKALQSFLVLLMVAALLPAGVAGANTNRTRHISLRQDGERLLQNKLDGKLAAAFAENEYVHILVKFREQADPQLAADLAMGKIQPNATAYERKIVARFAAIDVLREVAADSQGPVLSLLQQYQATGKVKELDNYFIVNIIHALTTQDVVNELALRPEVEKVLLSNWTALEEPVIAEEGILSGPGRQWNIDNVGAYAVWDTYGLDGTGVVVGIIDTGTYYQHEALVEKWRGYNGPGSFDPVYNWFDAIDGRSMPYDEPTACHGTHVMGTIVGGCPATDNLIGMAPGAKWITAKAFDEEGGYDHWILNAAQYLLAPTDALGNPDPGKAPDIINNSWGGGPGFNEWFRPMVRSWRAAQILPVFSAGNDGPGTGTVGAPSNYPDCIAVAAVNSENGLASFSGRGPGPYDDLKPDVAAPGVAIRSSIIGGGYESAWSGTSMAAPHVSGAAALLLQANAALTVDQIEEILYTTAHPLTDAQYPQSPNYGYGRGLINAFDAVAATLSGFGTITGQVLVEGEDIAPPTIDHSPTGETIAGMDTTLSAQISDDVAVVGGEIWVLPDGAGDWTVFPMTRIAGSYRDGLYQGTIASDFAVEPGFTYKIVAIDWAGKQAETPEQYVRVLYGIEPGVAWDFEDQINGWYMDGDWEWGVPTVGPTPASGTKLVATNLSGNYSTYSDSWLLSPPLDLRNQLEASFRLRHWYDIETNYDGGAIVITSDLLTGEIIATVTGKSNGWKNLSIDLGPYCGSADPVYVLFAFESDSSVCYPGWYIDSIDYVGVDEDPPSVPVNLVAAPTATGISLSWTESPDLDLAGYMVYRSESPGGPYANIGTTPMATFSDREVSGGTEYFYVISAIDLSGNESGFSEEASATAPAIEVLLFADFEADDGGFVSGGNSNCWQWGNPTSGPGAACSGDRVWATNLSGDYPASSDCWLKSPAVELADYQSAILEFSHWYETENNYDKLYLEVSTDDSTWTQIGYYTGVGSSWQTVALPLDNYIGETIWVRYRLSADSSVCRAGWYVDDFGIIGSREAVGIAHEIPDCLPMQPAVYTFTRGLRPSERRQDVSAGGQPWLLNGGIPVEAVVTVVESNRSVRTDPATGRFSMIHPAVPDGASWTLRFESYGYFPQEVPFSLAVDEEIAVNVSLDPIPRGSIAGYVANSRTGEPIPEARIILVEDARVPSVVSDEHGDFRLEGVLEGAYTLRISAPGFIRAEFPVTVAGNETVQFAAVLEPFIGHEDEIWYDDGEDDNARAFYDGGNGWGVRFTPDGFAQLAGASVFIDSGWPSPTANEISVAVFASLANGDPGEMVIAPFIVEGNKGDWTYIDLSEFGFCTDQDFYIIYVQVGDYPDCAGLGFDESSSQGRTYEWYQGEFSLSPPDYGNAMVRATVKYALEAPTLISPANGSFVNTDSVTVTGFVGVDCIVQLSLNGAELEELAVEKGEFQVEVDLEEGDNIITASAKIESGTTDPSAPLLIIRDTVAPELVVDAPTDGTVTNKEVVTVSGYASDVHLAEIKVNGVAVEFTANGEFIARTMVEEGANQIVVRAEDRAGNYAEQTITVVVSLDAPELFDLQPDNDLTVRAGSAVPVSFRSETSGGSATFAILLPGTQQLASFQRQEMQETEAGVYEGQWQAPAGTSFKGAIIEFELVDSAGNRAVAIAPGRLTVEPAKPPVPPVPPVETPGAIIRLSGSNRFATAAAVSQQGWETADTVILARADGFADSLAGIGLSKKLDAPILLAGAGQLNPATKAEIIRLGATKIIILGGVSAIAKDIEDQLIRDGFTVVRIGGDNRFETAALIGAEVLADGCDEAIVVYGYDFPDALAIAPVAGGCPILMTEKNQIPAATRDFLIEHGIKRVRVVGGPRVISEAVLTELQAVRVSGSNRYETAVALAQAAGGTLEPALVFIASGQDFADALCLGALAAKRNSCLLLVAENAVPAATARYLENRGLLKEIIIAGGERVIPWQIVDALRIYLEKK